jgi:hypothetical protein
VMILYRKISEKSRPSNKSKERSDRYLRNLQKIPV